MQLTQDHVLDALKRVIDPELFVNIVDLGLIYEVKVEPIEGTEGQAEPTTKEPATKEPATKEPATTEVADAEAATSAKESEENAASAENATAESAGEPEVSWDQKYNVKIEMTMTSPMCPAGPQLVADSKQHAGSFSCVEEVDVKVVMDPQWTQDRMTDDAKDQLGIF